MSANFQNPGYISRNGKQSSLHSEHAVHSSFKRGSFFNTPTNNKRMEAKLFLTVLSYIGLGSYIAGVFLNIGTWKADLLAVFGFAFILLKFIRLTIRTWQSYKREEIEQQILKKQTEED
jgi:hypothetical protein